MSATPAELLSLFEGCKANPDEDAPRLVLADWLEENGEVERAEFVRAQTRAASLPEYDPERSTEVRAKQLLRRRASGWAPGWVAGEGFPGYSAWAT